MTISGGPTGHDAKNRTILVTAPGFAIREPEIGGALEAAGLRIRLAPKTGERTPAEVRELVRDACAAIVSTDPFDRSVFNDSRGLRVVARTGVGLDSVDLAAATSAGVVVTTSAGVIEESVADHTLALLLALLRRLVENDASVRRGEWNRGVKLLGFDLYQSTVGLIGYGRIGRAVARRLLAFEAEILVCDSVTEPEPGIQIVELEELLQRSQAVSLHVPLTPETQNLIGARELAMMRPDAVLINTSRGSIIDEHALINALERREILGAALDVFVKEPPATSRLIGVSNVLLTPHIGSLSVRSLHQMQRSAVEAVLSVLRGDRPLSVANPEVFDGVEHTER